MNDRRSRTEAILVLDRMVAAQDAIRFLDGFDEQRFFGSDLHQSAAIRALAVMGEAANKVSEPFRNEHKHIPWRK